VPKGAGPQQIAGPPAPPDPGRGVSDRPWVGGWSGGHGSASRGGVSSKGAARRRAPALTQQAVSNPRLPVRNERRCQRPPPGRRTGTTGEWPPAARRSPPAPAKDGLLRIH
jgi:hypothetical protein